MNELAGFLGLVVTAMVPFILAAQGTALSGHAGVFNVSQEGMMVLGASVGFLVSLQLGSNAAGLFAAGAAGAVFGAILGWTTTYLRLDQFVIGLALFFAALGTASLLYREVIGVTLTPPLIPTLRDVGSTQLARIPILGPVLFRQDAMVYAAFILSFALWWFLYRTDAGMRLRAVGENPKAADSLGIGVAANRMWAATLGSAMMATGGAYIPMVYTGSYTEGLVAGRGWLAIALTFFGGWRPQYIVAGAAFFAGMDVLALRAQVGGLGVPHQFISMLPYAATLFVMIFAFRWSRVPGALGKNYDRESRLEG